MGRILWIMTSSVQLTTSSNRPSVYILLSVVFSSNELFKQNLVTFVVLSSKYEGDSYEMLFITFYA
jgi:hypothetical protein